MRFCLTTLALLFFLIPAFSQSLVVDRLDKKTGVKTKQTGLYSMKDASGQFLLNVSLRGVDAEYSLMINVPKPVTIKKNSAVTLQFVNGTKVTLFTNSDIISIGSADVNKKLMVCAIPEKVLKDIIANPLGSILIPENDGTVIRLNLQTKDRGHIGKGVQLVAM